MSPAHLAQLDQAAAAAPRSPPRLSILRQVALDDLVDAIGVGGLLEALRDTCQERAELAAEDCAAEAAAWDAWADRLHQIPGLRPRTPTLPRPR